MKAGVRHEQYGGSVYLLEPEVKEGEGGLRDIQTARWIARAKLKAKDLDTLALNGIVGATRSRQSQRVAGFSSYGCATNCIFPPASTKTS